MEFRYETFNHCSSLSLYPNGLPRDESLLLFSFTPKPRSWAKFPLTPEIVSLTLELVTLRLEIVTLPTVPLPTVPLPTVPLPT